MAGSALFEEGKKRNHDVTAIVRNETKARERLGADAKLLVVKDVFDLTREDLAASDVVINAYAPPVTEAYYHIDFAAKLVHLFRGTEQPRLFFILGAGSLLDKNGELALKMLERIPEAASFIETPRNQVHELELLKWTENINWVGVSPSLQFIPGEAATPLIGKDHLLFGKNGEAVTTNKTMAVAIFDEIEHPRFIRERFTVANS